MTSVGYAIPENYDTVLNTDNRSVPNVYINGDTGEKHIWYDRLKCTIDKWEQQLNNNVYDSVVELGIMVFAVTFNNISVISWRSV
jgi:hypothetical protein